MKNAIFVALISSNTIQREGLVSILRKGGFSHIRTYRSVAELSQVRLPTNRRIVWLIDVRRTMGNLSDVVDRLRIGHPRSSVVLLADECGHAAIMQAMECNVDGFLLDKIAGDVMVKSLELVMLGEKVFPATSLLQICKQNSEVVVSDVDAFTRMDMLSDREAEVLQKLMAGHSNKAIARDCGITESTVKVHVKAILRKIHAKNRTQAAVWARKFGVNIKPRLENPKLLSLNALQTGETQHTDDDLSIQPNNLLDTSNRQHYGSKANGGQDSQ